MSYFYLKRPLLFFLLVFAWSIHCINENTLFWLRYTHPPPAHIHFAIPLILPDWTFLGGNALSDCTLGWMAACLHGRVVSGPSGTGVPYILFDNSSSFALITWLSLTRIRFVLWKKSCKLSGHKSSCFLLINRNSFDDSLKMDFVEMIWYLKCILFFVKIYCNYYVY